MEIWRQPNAATVIVFPLLDLENRPKTGASGLDSEFVAWSDAAAPGNGNNFVDCTNEATEIGTTGLYSLSLTTTELPAASPYVMVRVIATSTATQYILISTATQHVDARRWRGSEPLVLTSGRVDVTVGAMQTGVITSAAHAAGAIDAAAIATDAIGAAEVADGTITAATFAAGAIDATAIADNAIDAGAIAASALTSAKFAAGVLPTNFGSQVINASGYVFVGQIATYAIAATSFEDSAITARSIATDAITAAKVADGTIDANTFAAGAINAAAIAADAITAAKVSADVGSEFADALLKRNVASGSTGGREVRDAFALLRNKVTIASGTMTVTDTDDTTSLWTATVATVSYNAQVVTIDPA